MNVLSTNRRKIGAIVLIAAGIIAVAVPFLLRPPLNANTSTTTTSGNTNTKSNTNPTSPSSSNSNSGGGSNTGNGSGNGGGSSTGTGSCDNNDKDKNDATGDPGHGKGKGHAYAYGHSKGDDRDKDPLHAVMNRLSRLGADSPAFHHHNSTRTDNGLGQENSQASLHSESNHADACQDDDNETETD